MSTTYQELYQKVHLRLNSSEGRALLFAKEAVNDAHKWVARVKDFDELLVWDTSNPATVQSQESYDLVTDWGLTRPKDVYSIIYYTADSSSRKLEYWDPQEYDEHYPYPGVTGEQEPQIYTQKGSKVYLQPIPDAADDLRVYYSQWPLELSADTDETSYDDIDDVIIGLAYEIATANLSGAGISDWTSRAGSLLSSGVMEHRVRPDQKYKARPFKITKPAPGQYWKNPMVKENP